METKKYILTGLLAIAITISGCEKFLDAKPDHKLAVPETLTDLQALLDNYSVLNTSESSSGEVSGDDYYLTPDVWAALASEDHKRMHTWQKDLLFTTQLNDWHYGYRRVYYCNSVLEQLSGAVGSAADHQNVEGQAFFHRGRTFLQMAWLWSLAWDAKTADTEPGIPLRMNSDFNETSRRASIRDSYEQIISDLKAAARLLPVTSLHPMRPSKPAAYAMLARTYLSMGEYVQAGSYADSCLRLKSELLDYNNLNAADTYPVPQFNAEVIFDSYTPPPAPLSMSRARITDALYQSYAADDLRKTIFFRNNNNGTFAFKGSYDQIPLFMGIAADEVYLIRAECYARAGNTVDALKDLNVLLIKRWKKNTFTPLTAATSVAALNLVLSERRKELLMRGLRWSDLKRLNREGAAISLSRAVNNQVYVLEPNDLRYALPIPEEVISLTNMTQNRR
ncbi:MAG: RagB/SusD family nutrient uptake outer membrane protein [Daejeonella sp.]